MFIPIFSVLAVAATIAVAYFFAQSHSLNKKLVVSALTSLVGVGAVFGGFQIAWKYSYDDALTFTEYWNGYETGVNFKDVQCYRDGSCVRKYDCDPYQVPVVKVRTTTDSQGNTKTETYTELETHYHSCPYSNVETSYYLDTSLGTMAIATNVMTGTPFRAGTPIPGGQQTAPVEWVEAQARIEANTPNGVTKQNRYDNYILASENTILREYSPLVEEYLEQNLLPTPTASTDLYAAKVHVVDGAITPEQLNDYTVDLGRLNGIFGEERQGDLHLVFVPGNTSTDYLNAVHAYWLDKSYHGKNTIAKNTITVVVAVDNGNKVAWAGGFTGMPHGNESLLQSLTNLRDKPVDADFIGSPMVNLTNNETRYTDGLIERLMLSETAGFNRVSMSEDEQGEGGFKYLSGEVDVEISGMTYFVTALGTVLVLAGINFAAYAYYMNTQPSGSTRKKN